MKFATLIVIVVVFIFVSSVSMALGQFKDGGTHDISSTINDDVWVDYQAPGLQTTVNLLNWGQIPNPYGLYGYNESKINICGGSTNFLISNNHTETIINDGWIKNSLVAFDDSKIILNGGKVSNNLIARNNSYLVINGGWIDSLQTYDSSKVIINGLDIPSNGATRNYLVIEDNSQLIIMGYNFTIDGVAINFGQISNTYNTRVLTGILANGKTIDTYFSSRPNASINLVLPSSVPEPSSLVALLGGVSGLIAFKRRKR